MRFFKFLCCCCYDREAFFTWRRAPEPTDVYWENLGVSWVERAGRSMLSNLATFLLVLVCFAAVSGLKLLQEGQLEALGITGKLPTAAAEPDGADKPGKSEDVREKLESFADAHGAQFLSAAASFFVIVVNALLLGLVRRFSMFEKKHTLTEMNVSVALKLTVARFVNSSLVLVLVNRHAD